VSLQVPCMACTNRSEILLVLNSSALPLTAHMRSWTNAIAVLLRRVTEAYNSDASLRAEWSSLLCNRLFATPSRPKWGCGESAFDQKGPITPSDVRIPAIGRVALRSMEPYKIVYSGREDISRAMAAIKRARSDGYLMVRHRGPKAGLGSPCSVLMVWGHQAISTEENAELLVSHAGEWLQSRKAAYTKGSAMAARLSAEFGIEDPRWSRWSNPPTDQLPVLVGATQLYCLVYHFSADVWTRETSTWLVGSDKEKRRAELRRHLDVLDAQLSVKKGPLPWNVTSKEGVQALRGTTYPVEYPDISDAEMSSLGLFGYEHLRRRDAKPTRLHQQRVPLNRTLPLRVRRPGQLTDAPHAIAAHEPTHRQQIGVGRG